MSELNPLIHVVFRDGTVVKTFASEESAKRYIETHKREGEYWSYFCSVLLP